MFFLPTLICCPVRERERERERGRERERERDRQTDRQTDRDKAVATAECHQQRVSNDIL